MLEGVEDEFLTGDDDRLFFTAHRPADRQGEAGRHVVTTLNTKAQGRRTTAWATRRARSRDRSADRRDPGAGEHPVVRPGTFAGNSLTDEKNWKRAAEDNDPNDPMLTGRCGRPTRRGPRSRSSRRRGAETGKVTTSTPN